MTAEEFLKAIARGVDWGPKPLKLLWTSPDGKHAVFTAPGHSYRSGQDTKYGRAKHCLVNLQAESADRDGYRLFVRSRIAEIEGRISQSKLNELIAQIPTQNA